MALGASNLTRGFQALVAMARERGGADVEVIAALGHGRSYGSASRVWVRTLPGILECGLWQELERRQAVPCRALVTDVGNDILYGASVAQLLDWVEECVVRLQRHTPDVVLTDLPLFSLRHLSPVRFALFRSVLFPLSRLTRAEVVGAAEQVAAGLERLAARRGARLFRPRPEWYGLDPIHIRPGKWRTAFGEMMWGEAGGASATRGQDALEALRLYAARPEREWLFGIQRRRSVGVGVALKRGGRVWLY